LIESRPTKKRFFWEIGALASSYSVLDTQSAFICVDDAIFCPPIKER
jgi:hypothetical protein